LQLPTSSSHVGEDLDGEDMDGEDEEDMDGSYMEGEDTEEDMNEEDMYEEDEGDEEDEEDRDEEDIDDNNGAAMLDHTSMTSMIWDIYGKVAIDRNSTWVVKVTFVY